MTSQGPRSSSSGRVSTSTNSLQRIDCIRCSTRSSRPESAYCASSKTSTTGSTPPTRSRNVVHATNRSVRSKATRSPPLTSAATRGSSHAASSSVDAAARTPAAVLSATVVRSSVSRIRNRERTISANAQNAAPSP